MNSQEYRSLQEAYLQVYSSPILKEFGPGDAGGSLAIKRTFGGAPGTQQNTTVSGSASKGSTNVSGSLTKGTFSGQGDKTSQGVDNAIKDYEDQEKNPKPKVPFTPRPTGTSTITTGVRGTLDANVSGKIGPGSNTQSKIKAEMQKREMLRTAATNIQNQQKAKADAEVAKAKAAALKSTPDGGKPPTPDDGKSAAQQETDKANSEKEARNSTYLKNRADLVRAGVTDEAGNENPNGRRDLENRLGGKDGATAGDLLGKLRNVTDNNTAAQLRNSTGVRKIVQKSSGVYGAESFDYFDAVRDYLLDEGYADTEHAAEAIMANMSDAWVRSIIG